MKWKKFILLGDSNTQFGFSSDGKWASQLADYLQRKCDVVCRGFSGYNTNHIRTILPQIMDEFEPANVCGMTVMLGTNDSTLSENKIQHCPIEQFGSNMRAIIDYILNDFGLDPKKLIFIVPGRIFDSKFEEKKISQGEKSTHFDHLFKDYAEVCRQIGVEKKLEMIDLHKLMTEYGANYDELLNDGLHLSSRGSEMLFSALKEIVSKNIEPELRFQFPYYRDLKPGQTKIDQ